MVITKEDIERRRLIIVGTASKETPAKLKALFKKREEAVAKKAKIRALQKKYTKKVAKGYKTRAVKKYTTGKIKESPIVNIIKAQLKKQSKVMAAKYKKSLKRSKKRKMPAGLKRYLKQKKARAQRPQKAPQPTQRYPTSIREAQQVRNLRNLLTPREQQIVDRIYSGSQRAAAMQMIRRRIKARQHSIERVSPQMIVKRDIMTGRDRIEAQPPKELWES